MSEGGSTALVATPAGNGETEIVLDSPDEEASGTLLPYNSNGETEIVLGSPDEASDTLLPYKLRAVLSAPPDYERQHRLLRQRQQIGDDCRLSTPPLTRIPSLRRRQSCPHYGEQEDDYYEEDDCKVAPDARHATKMRRGGYIRRLSGLGLCFVLSIGVCAAYLSTASSKSQKRLEIAKLQVAPDLPDLLAKDDPEDASAKSISDTTSSTWDTEVPVEEEKESEDGQSMLNSSPALAAILQPILDGEATFTPTYMPTGSPTYSPTLDGVTHFYVFSDTPHDDNERQTSLPEHIAEASGDPSADFLVHVGGVQNPEIDRCEEYAYREASGVLAESEVPVFVLPGEHDIDGCANATQGRENWRKYFYKFDERQHWGDHGFRMTRWGELEENFSFLHRGVLYFGLSIGANGKVARRRENLQRIRDMLALNSLNVVVLFAGAEQKGHNDDFFREFYSIISQVHRPVIHFHGGGVEYVEKTGEDLGLPHYLVVSLEGSVAPIGVKIDGFRSSPITLNRGWKSDPSNCCDSGWPPRDYYDE